MLSIFYFLLVVCMYSSIYHLYTLLLRSATLLCVGVFFFLFTGISSVQAENSWVNTPIESRVPHWSVPLEHKPEWVKQSNIYADVYASEQDKAVAIQLARYSHNAIPKIAEKLGVSTGGAMQIYIAENQEEFLRMQPNLPPDWADGTAWPNNGWIFLRSPSIRRGTSEPLTQVLDHEIVHILLGRAFAHRPVPRWLQEGVAQVVSGEYTLEKIDMLGGIATPIPITSLTRGFPSDPVQANIAYAESASFVAFLFRNFGVESLQILIDKMSSGMPFQDAIVFATGKHIEELDSMWQEKTYEMPLWIRNISVDGALLGFLSILILLGSIRKYTIYRQENRTWEYEEKVHQQLIVEMSTWKPMRYNRTP